MRILVLIVALLGCKDAEKQRAEPPSRVEPESRPTIRVGAFTVPIPDGFRDLAEAFDAEATKRVNAAEPAGARELVTDKGATGPLISMLVMREPIPVSNEDCDVLARAMSSTGTVSAAVATGRLGKGCLLTFTRNARKVQQYLMATASSGLIVVCDGASEAACATVALGATTK